MGKVTHVDGQMNFIDGEGMTGEYMMQLADEWVNSNWFAWNKMLTRAAGYVSQRRRFSMENLLQFARYDLETNGDSQGFKVNNNTRAALTRKMLKKYPSWEKYVDKRSSKVDWL